MLLLVPYLFCLSAVETSKMGGIIINAVLLLIVHEIFLPAAASGKETCQLNRHMEEQCGPHTYKIVKPLLDYFREIRNELHQSEIKIKELNTNLIERDREIVRIQEKLTQDAFQLEEYKKKIQQKENYLQLCNNEVGKLKSQIHSQETTIDRLTLNSILFESYDKCKEELADKSKNLEAFEIQLKKTNSSLFEKEKLIVRYTSEIFNLTENQKTTLLQFKESQTKILKKESDYKLCQAEIKKLKSTAQNNIPSSCIPFGEYPGVHQIKVSGVGFFDVLCDSQFAGPGWIVIQQRVGGNENFTRDWASYREGFGSLESDFFIGLEKIYRLTSSRRHELFVHLVGLNGTIKYARYDDFKISDEDNGYALNLGKFKGDLKDALRDGENMKFSTFDRDNDTFDQNCAKIFSSGWWFSNCYYTNLNGLYGVDQLWFKAFRLKEVMMLIRPKE